MTNQDKAKQFMKFMEAGDSRCNFLVMMLSIAVGISEEECLERIKNLATDGEGVNR